MYINDVIP